MVFDAAGLPVTLDHMIDNSLGWRSELTQEFSFDAAGDLVEIRGQRGDADAWSYTVFVYDSHRNLTMTYVPGDVSTHYSFDCYPAQ